MNFKKRGKKSETSKYLLRSDWKKEVENIIKRWEGYRTYYYEKKIITRF